MHFIPQQTAQQAVQNEIDSRKSQSPKCFFVPADEPVTEKAYEEEHDDCDGPEEKQNHEAKSLKRVVPGPELAKRYTFLHDVLPAENLAA